MSAATALRALLGRHDGASMAEILAGLPAPRLRRILGTFSDAELEALQRSWEFWARAKQLPPPEPWTFWGVHSGRGFGKTRTGAEWFHRRAMQGDINRWMALCARNPGEARDINVEGPAGLLRIAPPAERPHYEPSKRRLTWPTGAWATIYSGENPNQARGFSGDTVWLDELAAYQYPDETWDNLLFGVREARVSAPKVLVTTTPRQVPIIRRLLADPAVRWVHGTSYENRANLAPAWFREILSRYEGTALGRQEIYGELLEETEGALWRRAWILRRPDPDRELLRSLIRLVIGVDPHATTGETGIVAVGTDAAGFGYVLADRTRGGKPADWALAAVSLYEELQADALVGEINNGGDMVEHTIRSVEGGGRVNFVKVHASRGKVTRAQPVSARYQQGRFYHCGYFGQLEDQLCNWVPGQGDSPNNLDALVWAATAALELAPLPTQETVYEDTGGFVL